MAASPTHRFGQIIGDVLEAALKEPLAVVAKRHNLYLDCKCPRQARHGQSKVGWKDFKGNRHDLDYVLEAGGTDLVIGRPRAFIEIAYRRYTKHSRNKAQEIQGAIAPLFQTYSADHPFIGVVLAGVFTDASLTQLRSHGFGVLYMPFDSIVDAFKSVGIDAWFDERSRDADVRRKVKAWGRIAAAATDKVGAALRKIESAAFRAFVGDLERALTRSVSAVFILALHGQSQEVQNVESAIAFIQQFDESKPGAMFARFEVNVRYTNSDEIRGNFESKTDAIKFLRALE